MSKEVKELQKRWLAMMDMVHSNSHVLSFMNSRVGQYLDDHPFVALSLMVFIAASAVPIAFFLVFVVTTTVLACIGVIVMEGNSRLWVKELGWRLHASPETAFNVILSLTTLLSYWPIREGPSKKENANGSSSVSNLIID